MIEWPRRRLGALEPIDSDPMTHRYAVAHRLPDLPAPLWYREIRPDHELPDGVTATAIGDAFRQAVAVRERCSAADRAQLDTRTDWSLAVVTERDAVVGVLLPGLPQDFRLAGGRAMTLRDLCASDEAAAANGLDRSAVDDELARLALAAHLACTIHLLHRNRIAYSDLTLDRVAVAGHPPRTMLIGCDPTVPLAGPAARSRAQTSGPDPARLALCLVRALAKGPGATQLTDPARVGSLLGQPGVELFTRALAPPPVQRPSAEQMHRYLVLRMSELTREHDRVGLPFPLPRFDVAAHLRGALPRLTVPSLPTVAAPPAPAPLPRRPLVSADEHPPPRIELPAFDVGAVVTNPSADGTAAVSSVLARAYVDAGHQLTANFDRGLRTLRAAIDERLPMRPPSPPLAADRPDRPAHPTSEGGQRDGRPQ